MVTFAPGQPMACGVIIIRNDTQVGESREVFAVLLSLPEDTPYIDFGSTRTATVVVTDTPGECVRMCVCHKVTSNTMPQTATECALTEHQYHL